MKLSNRQTDLKHIFEAGLSHVDPFRLILDSVSIQGSELLIRRDGADFALDMSPFEEIVVIGFGKATAKMALALEELLGDKISVGLISVKYGHTEELSYIETIEAGHPVPDENGIKAAKAISELASQANQKTLVFTLISGGGSALIPLPAEADLETESIHLTLAEKQNVTKVLLECGADITEINCVRKHLSGIKGGRLAEKLMPATSINLILSDVVGDRLDTIASGATSPDDTSFRNVAQIFEKYDITDRMPKTALKLLQAGIKGHFPETPKQDSVVFNNCYNFLVGTNYLALQAAKKKSEELGYETRIFTSMLTGEAREVAKAICAIAKEAYVRKKPGSPAKCLLFGGETTVTIKGAGKGGRNQEIALAVLAEMAAHRDVMYNIWFLSASTDGNDGPTDAAGAFADMTVLEKAEDYQLSIDHYLKNNDSYHFFEKLKGLLKTGPTNTNVCDIQIFIIE
ncbi:MAG: glycerate kinase [Proteobacteria bacterium]|nr:glycerate kinase [Pseudomonadota bacterium]